MERDYRKDYEEAFKRAKEDYDSVNTSNYERRKLETIFPELKDNEDERIRKELIEYLKQRSKSGFNQEVKICNNGITWLEKQGEQRTADKVEPKFKVGDWIFLIDRLGRIELIYDNGDYVIQYYVSGTKSVFSKKFCETHFHLWTIKDAKDGDVLATDSGRPFTFKGLLDMYHPESPVAYCGIAPDNSFDNNSDENNEWWTDENVYPATKEQRDLLFQKMKEAGYEWDAGKKELKKIEQKPAWSEEDEKTMKRIDSLLYSQCTIHESEYEKIHNWLKSLKDKMKGE